jgi:uncharacterized protein (DUF362 family)
MSSTVAITRNPHIERAIDAALAHVDLRSLVSGKRVAIKPNETYADEKDRTGVTQPDTLRAVIRAMKAHGPRELVVTGGSGADKTENVMRASGMLDVIRAEGLELVDHNQGPFVDVDLPQAPERDVRGPQKKVKVCERVLGYERLVVVSNIKLHETATVTMALKNVAMSYPAAEFYGYPRHTEKHENAFFDDMHTFIASMAKRFPIDLAINVGHPAMIATGPLGGHAVETGLCIVSRDALAADAVGARLLGFRAQAVRHLWEAQCLGLGQSDVDELRFPELSMKEAIEAFTEAAYGRKLTFEHP